MNDDLDDFYEDEIRPPDRVIREQLVEDSNSDYQKQINEAIQQSIQDIQKQELLNAQYENDIVEIYNQITNERKDLFREFLLHLNKLSKFDKEVREIYEIIDPIIESYCNQFIEVCELDEETYNKIFGLLKKIRNNKDAIDLLTKIIYKV